MPRKSKKGDVEAGGRKLLRHKEGYNLRESKPYSESQNSEEEEVIEQPKRGRKRKAEKEILEDQPKKRVKREKKQERDRGEDSRERETRIKREGRQASRKIGEKEKLKGYLRRNTFQGSYADRLRKRRAAVEEEEPRRGRTLQRKKAPRVTIPKRLIKAARKRRQLKPVEELASTNSSMEELSANEERKHIHKDYLDYGKEWWQDSRVEINYDDPTTIELKAFYPGIPKEDLSIELEPQDGKKMLTLTAVKIRDKEKIDQGDEIPFYFVERSYGSFVRSIPVPESVEASQITATYNVKEGYLHVLIPREMPLPQKHRIEIRTQEHQQQPSVTREVDRSELLAGAQSLNMTGSTAANAGSTDAGARSSVLEESSDAAPMTGVSSDNSAQKDKEPENVRKAKELHDAPLASSGFAEES